MQTWEDEIIEEINSITPEGIRFDRLAQMTEAASGLLARLGGTVMAAHKKADSRPAGAPRRPQTPREKIITYLGKQPEMTSSASEMMKSLRMPSEEMNQILDELRREGLVASAKQNTGGRPRFLHQMLANEREAG